MHSVILIKLLMALISIVGLFIIVLILGMDLKEIVLIYSGAIILSSLILKI